MDDFAVFVNDYLTPDQLSIQEYSCASDQSLYCLVDGSFNERGKHFSYLFEDKSVRSEGWVLDLEMLKKKHL